jgi:hypothetical protein
MGVCLESTRMASIRLRPAEFNGARHFSVKSVGFAWRNRGAPGFQRENEGSAPWANLNRPRLRTAATTSAAARGFATCD